MQEKYDLNQILKVAGNDLVEKAKEVLGEKNYLRWFNSKVEVLEGKTPYEVCKQGKKTIVYDVLGRIEWGVFS